MTLDERRQYCLDFLNQMGFNAELDEEKDITFKEEDYLFSLSLSDDDKNFYDIVFVDFWTIEDEENDAEMLDVYEAATYASTVTKMAKIIITEPHVHAAAQTYCPTVEIFHEVFEDALSSIKTAAYSFLECLGVFDDEDDEEGENGEEDNEDVEEDSINN